MGILTCPSDQGYLALHRHEQAEVYYIMDGKGTMQVAKNVYEVRKGDIVYVPSNAEHGIWNIAGNAHEAASGEGEDSRGEMKSKGRGLEVPVRLCS